VGEDKGLARAHVGEQVAVYTAEATWSGSNRQADDVAIAFPEPGGLGLPTLSAQIGIAFGKRWGRRFRQSTRPETRRRSSLI
jgi:hypothetical protein